jgi:hypothetical protein
MKEQAKVAGGEDGGDPALQEKVPEKFVGSG